MNGQREKRKKETQLACPTRRGGFLAISSTLVGRRHTPPILSHPPPPLRYFCFLCHLGGRDSLLAEAEEEAVLRKG
jgi:hypothetical protein